MISRHALLCIAFLSPLLHAQTELERAAKGNDIEAMTRLLGGGADINGTDPDSTWERTPLIAASLAGKQEAVVLLLERGADPDRLDASGSTALIRAIKKGHARVVDVLLEAGANTEIATDDGSNRTPLIWAILYENETIVASLLRHGADPHASMRNLYVDGQPEKSCLDLARERGTPKMVAMLEAALR